MYKEENKTKIIKENVLEKNLIDIYILTKVKTICPAVILAANRNESVIGRTKILVVSINTRKGFNQSGAPSGRKWAVEALKFMKIDEIIRLSHKGNPILRVIIKWLDKLRV